MPDRLTDKTEKTSGFSLADLIHLVDVSDSTDNAAGSSFKVPIGNLLGSLTVLKILGCLVVKWNGTPNNSTIQANDWVLWMDLVEERLIMGVAVDNVTTIPADLDDNLKFTKMFENDELLP